MKNSQVCQHCDGQGYIEIRDCAGEILWNETCSFCGGTGELAIEQQEADLNQTAQKLQIVRKK